MLLHLLLLDACVLIDFCTTDPALISSIATHVGPVHVAGPVLDEVDQLDEGQAASLGITVVDPPLVLAQDAATRQGALSFKDWLCVLLAETNGWTCVSNDGRLRRECKSLSVPTLWGLEPIAMLVHKGVLDRQEAIDAAAAIQRSNPRYITDAILDRFAEKLRQGAK